MLPIWNFFLHKRQFTILVMLALLIAGTVSVVSITKESAPEVQIPIGIVSTVLPGAGPEEVERLVTNKIEARLANIADLNKLTSTSREGFSTVVVEFSASADLEKSIQKLKDEVDKVQADLPEDATDPVVTDVNFADQPVQIISISADRPLAALGALGEELKNDLQTVRGVSRIEVSGARDREISIVVKKEELARYHISLGQVVAAVGAAHATLPVGSIITDNIAYNVAFEGRLDEVEDLANLPILNLGGQPIYLRDVATVSDGVSRAVSYTRISKDGSPSEQALTLQVFKVRGVDVTDTTSAVRERLDELKDGLLAGSAVVITNDAGELVQWRPDIEARFVVARFLSAARGGQRRRWRRGDRGELGEVPFDRDIARGEVPLIDVKEVEILLEHEDVFGAIVARQGRDDLGLRRVTSVVPMSCEGLRVALAGHDVAEDAEAGHPGDVADHQRELHVHLDQRFLHPLHQSTRALDQRGPMSEIPAQGDDAVGGTEAPAQQPEDVQVPEPFAVGHIALPAREILNMARIDEDHLEAARVEDLEDRNPIHPGGFHRHVGDAAGGQPVGQPLEVAGEGREGLDRRGVAIRRDGDEVLG